MNSRGGDSLAKGVRNTLPLDGNIKRWEADEYLSSTIRCYSRGETRIGNEKIE